MYRTRFSTKGTKDIKLKFFYLFIDGAFST